MPVEGGASGRFYGIVKAYYPERAYGFIECPEATEMYGREVFFNLSEVGDLHFVGAEICFSVRLNRKNEPQACQVSAAAPLPHQSDIRVPSFTALRTAPSRKP